MESKRYSRTDRKQSPLAPEKVSAYEVKNAVSFYVAGIITVCCYGICPLAKVRLY